MKQQVYRRPRPFIVRAVLTLALGTAGVAPSLAQATEPAPNDEKLDVVVCLESKEWRRPSPEGQQQRQRRPRRTRQEETTLESIWWIRDFVFYQGGPSSAGESEVFRLSGAWSARDVTRHCYDEKWRQDIDDKRYLDLWVFLHEILSVTQHGHAFTIVVEPTGQGFQLARIPRPEHAETNSVTFTVVTPEGKELETVSEATGPPPR